MSQGHSSLSAGLKKVKSSERLKNLFGKRRHGEYALCISYLSFL